MRVSLHFLLYLSQIHVDLLLGLCTRPACCIQFDARPRALTVIRTALTRHSCRFFGPLISISHKKRKTCDRDYVRFARVVYSLVRDHEPNML